MPEKAMTWPDGKACAALISVNLDAEYFGRIYYPDADIDNGDILRLGQTGMRFGLPHLLDIFARHGVTATFFVPGEVARRYPDALRDITKAGHEIGCHGDRHENFALLPRQGQIDALERAFKTLTKVAGAAPVGFRMPEGEITEETLELVKSMGFLYSSSLSDDDVPYRRQPSTLLELPIHWELFDLPYFVFTFDPPIPPGQARSAAMDKVLDNWLYELDGARRWGTLLNLQLDPQATGEQGRLFMLEKLLDEMHRAGDVWIATGRQVAEYCDKVL